MVSLPLAPFLFWHITYCFFRPHQNKLGLLYHFNRASAVASNEQLLINADGTGGPLFSKSTYDIETKTDFFFHPLLGGAIKVFMFRKQAQSHY
jgi:hypothetical protein